MSTTTSTDVTFRRVVIPASVNADDAADFVEMARVRNLVYREISGHDDHGMAADELLPYFRRDEYERTYLWVAELDGDVVGRLGVDIPLEEGSHVASWYIELRKAAWGRGIGAAGYDLVERTAREHGRRVLQSWAQHPAAGGPRLSAPTGFGEIPRDHAARFFLRHGYALEQITRISAFDLQGSTARVQSLLAHARNAAAGYRVMGWLAPTPSERAAGYAWMKSRMITDTPAAALEFDEEVWDAARVARHDARYVDSGSTLAVTAAQHIATGELCAFNELVIGKDRTKVTRQEDTLVLHEHRGHRLGMLVKCEALVAWRDIAPRSPRVITYNAEENRPMLDINEAIGFVPIAYEGAWKKVVT